MSKRTTGRRTGARLLAVSLTAILALRATAESRDRIVVVGSSTVYPFSVIVAEHFARSGSYPMPLIRSSSTGRGFDLFCGGAGVDTPDVANASRRMLPAERARCAANGVRRVTELRIGYDSLVLLRASGTPGFDVTLDELWRAIAKFVPVGGRFVPNPYRRWRDIDPRLPDRPIRIFGPAPTHGTRDELVTLVLERSCAATAAGARLPPSQRETVCGAIRDDGRWTDMNNLELVLGKLAHDPQAMGVMTYSYVEEFPNRVAASKVDGVAPTPTTIASGVYPISRPLFLYVKDTHLGVASGLADFAAEFLSYCASGANGYLIDEGLVALPKPELQRQRAVVARLQR
jgi:phosphate transport system substrate-binding protein